MKNIHVLPTEKPSRLRVHECGQLFLSINFIYEINDENKKHIYITSEEEIKEGDWVYVKTPNIYGGNVIAKSIGNSNGCWADHILTETTDEKGYHPSHCVKIILTTDQDLIKDGVQAIDDEFLEWFVKNPSCERVEVTKIQYNPVFDEDDLSYDGMTAYYNYKIIIPKEEAKQEMPQIGTKEFNDLASAYFGGKPKQETQGYICPHTKLQCDDECCVSAEDCHIKTTIGIISEPKQETLEQAAREYYKRGQLGFEKAADTERAFLRGGLWQQEQDNNKYSEEDVLKILHKFGFDYTYNYKGEKTIYGIPEWFQEYKILEQLKNK